MKVFKFLLSLLITITLTVVLAIRIGKVPPLGTFLDPFHGLWQNAEDANGGLAQSLSIDGLQAEVTVRYDSLLIPHIFAENEHDLYVAQGFVTAANRLWQMEFITHAAAGRVSEVVGEAALDFDRLQRRKGLPYSAEQALHAAQQDSVTMQCVEAYAAGVNAYINSLDYTNLPLEYKLLDYAPEAWTPLKSFLLLKYMANDLTYSDVDRENTNTLKLLGKDRFRFLFPVFTPEDDPVISKETPWKFKPVAIDTPQVDFEKFGLSSITGTQDSTTATGNNDEANPDNGSNNWAVSGSKTKSGKPILANDPHLGLNLPNIWYAVQLHSPEVNVLGASLPGAPNVIIGYNDSIAWGVTNARRDVVDWYKIDFTNSFRTEYRFDEINLKTQERIEEIRVRDGAVIYDTVMYTHHGPVVYDAHFPSDTVQNGYRNFALKWIAHEPSLEIKTFYALNRASNYTQYKDALQYYASPAQNFAFASVKGDIAMWVQGKFPAKWKGQGEFLMDGSKRSMEWQQYIPAEQNAHSLNPARGFVSSANQVPADASYPYYIYDYNYEHYRNRRINMRLTQMRNIVPNDMMSLQNDNYNLKASEVLPMMLDTLDLTTLSKEQQDAYANLRKWNYANNPGYQAPVYFEVWWEKLSAMMWDEFNGNVFRKPDSETTVDIMLHHPDDPFMDRVSTSEVETMPDLVRYSFEEAIEEVVAWRASHEESFNWSNYEETTLTHMLRLEPFSRSNIYTGGGRGVVNATSHDHGPSWRMVVSLEQPVRAWGVYPGGQSGNPGSPFYDNMVDKWRKGEYYDMMLLHTPTEEPERMMFTQYISPQ